MQYGFGVDLGGTTVKIAYFNEEGTLLEKWEIPTDTSNQGSRILPDIAAAIGGYLEKNHIPKEQILGVGIGVPGAVTGDGEVNRCINLGWGKFNIHQALEQLTGFPVKAGNDASVAALGECWRGGGQGCPSMVFVTLGTGVGGGIVVDGRLIHGIHGAGGEIGHLVLERKESRVCGCGKKGCVEQYCSATGIVYLANQALQESNTPSTLRQCRELTCKDVFDAGKAGDTLALEILEKVYAYLGEFIANVCCVVDPEVVVFGGGVSKAGKPLLEGAKKYFDQYIFHAARSIRFELAELGNDAGAYGAFKLALDAYGK